MSDQHYPLPLYAPDIELRMSIESQLVRKLRRERDEAHKHLMDLRALLEEAERKLDHLAEKDEDSAAA